MDEEGLLKSRMPSAATAALIGAWRLVAMEYRHADGRVRYPYGRDATGYIIYTAGHVDGRRPLAVRHRIPTGRGRRDEGSGVRELPVVCRTIRVPGEVGWSTTSRSH